MINTFKNSSYGGVLVEAAFIIPLALAAILIICELYFSTTRYFASRDGFSQAERRISLPLTVLTSDTLEDKRLCSDIARNLIVERADILGSKIAEQDLKVETKREDSTHLLFTATVQNPCVVCGATGVYFPIDYNFESSVFAVNGLFTCIPDGEL